MKGKYTRKHTKSLALVLALVLVIGCVAGGTLAWLMAKTGPVENTFSTSDIGVELEETTTDYKMIPGWTIAKDPKASVTEGSEAAWLFVKIDESANFDEYMTYAIADGWETVVAETEDSNFTVIARKVDGTTNAFGTEYPVLKDNQVSVKEEVTEAMMETAKTSQPTLTFTAYAVQLYKDNNKTEFSAADAWTQAQTLNTAN